MTDLYHYSCDHGARGIERTRLVVPISYILSAQKLTLAPLGWLAWFTDLDAPIPAVLGLTSSQLGCDRTTHRFRVTDPAPVVPWLDHPASRTRLGRALMTTPGGMPRHWFVSEAPVPVEAAPRRPTMTTGRLEEVPSVRRPRLPQPPPPTPR